MNTENTKAQMRKGILEYCILTVLSKKEAYPSDIIEELKKASDVYYNTGNLIMSDEMFDKKLQELKTV